MKKDYYKYLPEHQKKGMEKYVPAVTKVINSFDPIGVFPDAPEDHYESEIYAICFHLGLLGSGVHFLSISRVIYIELAHSFSITEIAEVDCLKPAEDLFRELGLSE